MTEVGVLQLALLFAFCHILSGVRGRYPFSSLPGTDLKSVPLEPKSWGIPASLGGQVLKFDALVKSQISIND